MKDLTQGNLSKTFINFAIPAILAGLLSQAYSLIDSIIIGQYLHTEGLAAIGATSGFISMIESLFWGFGVGCGIYVAMLFGAKRPLELRNTILSSIFVLSVAALLIGGLIIVFCGPILDLLRVDPLIRNDTAIYLCIIMGGMVFLQMTFFGVYVMNALGIAAFPLYMSILTSLVNIGGNLLSVHLGWGIAGIAASTIFSAALVSVMYILKFMKIFRELGAYGPYTMKGYFRNALPYAIPSMLQQCVMYLSSALVSPLVNGIGAHASAAYAIAQRIYNLIASIYQNATKILANFTSQCVGSGNYHRIRNGVQTVFYQALIATSPLIVICALFPSTICGWFFDDGVTETTMNLSTVFLRLYLPFVFFNIINNVFHNLLKGIKSTNLLVFSSAFGAAVRVAFSFVLAPFWGMHGVYAGWALSWVIEANFAIIVYFSGKWETPQMKEALRKR